MKNVLDLVFFLTLLCSCAEQSKPAPSPKDVSSPSEMADIEASLEILESQFESIGVEKNLRELPIFVTDELDSASAGECARERYIAINRESLLDLSDRKRHKVLWSILLHEIGHCYFGLSHFESEIEAPQGEHFAFESEMEGRNGRSCRHHFFKRIPGTIMSGTRLPLAGSESLRIFYVKQVAGQIGSDPIGELLNIGGIALVQRNRNGRTMCRRD